MTRVEFDEITSRIENYYEKSINEQQRSVWFDELRDYTKEKYDMAIREIQRTSPYKPTLSVILETIKNIKTYKEQATQSEPCKLCRGTGYVIYKKVINGIPYDYACVCNCANAVGKDYDGSKIKDVENRSDYYIPKATDVFHVET